MTDLIFLCRNDTLAESKMAEGLREARGCIIHYDHLLTENPVLSPLTNETFARLVESKNARIELGGSNLHEAQANSIPARFIGGEYYVHRQCYQKFTKAISVLAEKRSRPKHAGSKGRPSPLKRKKRTGETLGILFPNRCMKCTSSRPLKVKGKKQDLRVLQTFSSCRMLKRAAELQNDEEMLLAIKDQDLIAREFKMHPQCYKEYTRVCSKQSTRANQPEVSNDNEDETSTSQKTKTNFESVCAFVQQHVIDGNQSISLKVLTDIYGFDKEDSRLRAKVKKRLEQAFAEKIVFVRVAYHESEIVVSKGALTATTLTTFIKDRKSFVLKEAASIIRSEILGMISSAQDLPWPPTPEALSLKSRQPPECVTDFVTNIIHATHHSPGEDVKRYASSIWSDLVHAVSKGNFLTEKHVLLGTGLHSLTGQKIPIKMLGKFGHSINYDRVRMIETAQAEVVQQLRSQHNPLPLLPATELDQVITFFWWDNFDCKKDNTVGSLHTTHGVAYQEESTTSLEQSISFQVEKSSRRSVAVTPLDLDKRKVFRHRNPSLFEASETMEVDRSNADKLLLIWQLMRRVCSAPQKIARFVGWIVQVFGKPNSKPTRITFLPPIRQPITEYSTVIECIHQSQRLSRAANMKYAHISVDAGAAQKFYHVVWNNPIEFGDVIIHLGDFHAMMEFFGTIGKLVTGSGFEEVVYQAGLCTSGGIKGVLSGKHYNRSWMIHECFAEAIERLFCEAFFQSIPEELDSTLKADPLQLDVNSILNETLFKEYEDMYNSFKDRCAQGEFGLTPQFWILYQQAVNRQHKLHLSINTNDYYLRLQCWKESLPYCFALNKQNYSRYGTYYCKLLENLDSTHPGARTELQEKGLSVCRNTLNVGQSIDGAGEQTFMRSSKTAGMYICRYVSYNYC